MNDRVSLGNGLRYGHDVTSMCPECLRTIPGKVSAGAGGAGGAGGVVMRKTCPEHGDFECVIATDVASYERMRRSPRFVKKPLQVRMPEAKGCPDDCGLCPAHDQHTCLAIVEITSRCNLPCPVCLADARRRGDDLSPVQVTDALHSLLAAEGQPVPLQFAGGEPTLHPELLAIVRSARALGFTKMEIDSNGILLADDPQLAKDLRAAGLSGVYLQMDGLEAAEHAYIRGRDLRAEKLRAIEHCRAAGLQVVLAVTVVPGVNDHAIWPLIQFAAGQRLTGINFQSVVLSGRYPKELARRQQRFTATHFLRAVEAQSGGQLRAGDLLPMSCPDPRCGLLAYVVLDRAGQLLPLSRLVGDERLRRHVADLSDWDTLIRQLGCDSSGCGCGDAGDGTSGGDGMDARARLADALQGADFFSIGFHGMMDAHCFDQERARRCCVHKLTADGRLMPFCLYNMKYRPVSKAVREVVRATYAQQAVRAAATDTARGAPPGAACCAPHSGLGCGSPTAFAGLAPGEWVLDLGSGAGFDCLAAAVAVGRQGRVVGIDVTTDMVRLARRHAADAGAGIVDFVQGELEALPFPDATFDVVISNCVINLCPDKGRLLTEAWRVLKPGGRLAVADVVARHPLPSDLARDLAQYAGCVAGAGDLASIAPLLRHAGFSAIRVSLDAAGEGLAGWAGGGDLMKLIAPVHITALRGR